MKRFPRESRSFVPESSIVGMLLDYHDEYTIVDSDGVGILQHNPLPCGTFAAPASRPGPSLTRSGRYADRTLHDFLAQCTPEERQVMVDTLFELVAATGAQRVKEGIPVGPCEKCRRRPGNAEKSTRSRTSSC